MKLTPSLWAEVWGQDGSLKRTWGWFIKLGNNRKGGGERQPENQIRNLKAKQLKSDVEYKYLLHSAQKVLKLKTYVFIK